MKHFVREKKRSVQKSIELKIGHGGHNKNQGSFAHLAVVTPPTLNWYEVPMETHSYWTEPSKAKPINISGKASLEWACAVLSISSGWPQTRKSAEKEQKRLPRDSQGLYVFICTATGQWFDMYICFLFYSLRLRKCISTRGVKLRDKGHALWYLIIDTRALLLLASGRDWKRRLKFFTEALQSVKAAPLRGVLGKTGTRS